MWGISLVILPCRAADLPTGNGGQTSDAREAHLSHYSTARGQFTENGRVFTSERELEAYRWDRAHGNAF